MTQLPAPELSGWLDDGGREAPVLLDVREPWEFDICRIPGSECRPLSAIGAWIDSIEDGRPIVCICHHGVRSLQVAAVLERRGCREIYNLVGGVDAWARQVDPAMATY
jgi:rhodanese-related sulfurtransferase